MNEIQKKIESELRRPNAGNNALCNQVADLMTGVVGDIGHKILSYFSYYNPKLSLDDITKYNSLPGINAPLVNRTYISNVISNELNLIKPLSKFTVDGEAVIIEFELEGDSPLLGMLSTANKMLLRLGTVNYQGIDFYAASFSIGDFLGMPAGFSLSLITDKMPKLGLNQGAFAITLGNSVLEIIMDGLMVDVKNIVLPTKSYVIKVVDDETGVADEFADGITLVDSFIVGELVSDNPDYKYKLSLGGLPCVAYTNDYPLTCNSTLYAPDSEGKTLKVVCIYDLLDSEDDTALDVYISNNPASDITSASVSSNYPLVWDNNDVPDTVDKFTNSLIHLVGYHASYIGTRGADNQ